MAFGAVFEKDRRHVFGECDVLGRFLVGVVVGAAGGDERQASGEAECDGYGQGETSSDLHRIAPFNSLLLLPEVILTSGLNR
jgi:hypothetical protein